MQTKSGRALIAVLKVRDPRHPYSFATIMFCFARKAEFKVASVLLDYRDPGSDENFWLPPAAKCKSQFVQIRSYGVFAECKLVYFPAEGPPSVLNGSVKCKGVGIAFQVTREEVWDLDFETFRPQQTLLLQKGMQSGLPSLLPFLSRDGVSPPIVWEKGSCNDFLFSSSVDGYKLAQEWVACLTLLHAKSTEALVSITRNASAPVLKYCVAENLRMSTVFMGWWPGPRPVNLQVWLEKLSHVSEMSQHAQASLRQFSPRHSGFYRCVLDEVSKRRQLSVDDESEVPYPVFEEDVNYAGRFSAKSHCGEVILVFPELIDVEIDESSGLVRSLQTSPALHPIFMLPYDPEGIMRQIGPVRSNLGGLWMQDLVPGTKRDRAFLEGVRTNAKRNQEAMNDLYELRYKE